MDNQILRDLFDQCIEAAQVLGVEDDLNEQLKEAKNKLIPTRIGKQGNIMEWPEEFEELEPGHRHISHLYGLYPSEQISVDGTPELAQAAKVTLERRLASGGGHTGWSRAWIINHYAKLWDGEKAYENIEKLLAGSTYDNHPGYRRKFRCHGGHCPYAGAEHAVADRTSACPSKSMGQRQYKRAPPSGRRGN